VDFFALLDRELSDIRYQGHFTGLFYFPKATGFGAPSRFKRNPVGSAAVHRRRLPKQSATKDGGPGQVRESHQRTRRRGRASGLKLQGLGKIVLDGLEEGGGVDLASIHPIQKSRAARMHKELANSNGGRGRLECSVGLRHLQVVK